MKDSKIIDYIKEPVEQTNGHSVRELLLCLILLYVIPTFVFLIFRYLWGEAFGFSLIHKIHQANINPWTAIILAPVFEELYFRLPLKRSDLNLSIGLFFFSFFIINSFFLNDSSAKLFINILFSTLIVVLARVLIFRQIKIIPYKLYFYIMALLFALGHCTNYIWEEFSTINIIYIFCMSLSDFVFAIIIGYLRISFGIVVSILSHILYNLPIFLLAVNH